jgi:hypothetical protein
MNISDLVLRTWYQFFRLKILKNLMRIQIRDIFNPGSGGKIRIRDKHPGSATLESGRGEIFLSFLVGEGRCEQCLSCCEVR